MALAAIGGVASCNALGPALADASSEVRDRVALAIYNQCVTGEDKTRFELPCAKLGEGMEKGNPSAAAILLEGHCHSAARLSSQIPEGRMKLEAWGPVVSSKLVASVARLHQGDDSQASVIAEAIRSKDLAETEFVLQVIREIGDPHLPKLLPGLDDLRSVVSLSGAPAGVPPRRICDAAVDAFSSRLQLQLPFKVRPAAKYTDNELKSAKSTIRTRLGL